MKYHETSLQVRFCEVDAYQVVWHGHYGCKTLATGSTTHVLTDLDGNLLYRLPPEVIQDIEAMRAYLEV